MTEVTNREQLFALYCTYICAMHTLSIQQMTDAFCVLFVLQDCACSPSAVNLSRNGGPPCPLCDHHASIPDGAWPSYGC